MTNSRNNSGGIGGLLAVAGAGLVMVACCVGPALIAGGALAVLGGALRSWGLIVVAAVVVLAAVVHTTRRRRRGAGADCCAPTDSFGPVDSTDPRAQR